jgi:hypothetical protein
MAVVPTTSNRFGGGGGRFSKMSKVCRIMLEKRGPSGVYLTTRLTSRNYTKGGITKCIFLKNNGASTSSELCAVPGRTSV